MSAIFPGSVCDIFLFFSQRTHCFCVRGAALGPPDGGRIDWRDFSSDAKAAFATIQGFSREWLLLHLVLAISLWVMFYFFFPISLFGILVAFVGMLFWYPVIDQKKSIVEDWYGRQSP